MISRKLLNDALSALTDTERKLIDLLTRSDVVKEEAAGFLKQYDIDRESSVATFLLNDLLDRFSLGETDSPSVPRIRGLTDFYRFQNATAMMRRPPDTVTVDADLLLRIRHPDTVRPFGAAHPFMDEKGLAGLIGKKRAGRILKDPEPVRLMNRAYLVPKERYVAEIIYLELYRALRYGQAGCNLICYVYDVYRYCEGKKPEIGFDAAILKINLRHKLGKVKRWLLKSKR